MTDPNETRLRPGEVVMAGGPGPGPDGSGMDRAGDAALWFIGRIETPWSLRAECPRRGDPEGGPVCRLILDPRWTEGLRGLVPGGRAQVLYWMDRARRDLVVQNPGHRGLAGTFSIRSPNRPNPIAVSSVVIVGVEGPCISVRGLDCLSGTPLLDLKPEHCPHAG